jgi:hypothetical protein
LVQVGGGTVLLLLVLVVGYAVLLLDWQARPYCHKQVYLSLLQWQEDHHPSGFPNAGGLSQASLMLLRDYLAGTVVEEKYRYVPGLTGEDPRHLVLLYLAQPTRWIWHGQPRSRLRPKGWIIVPVDFAMLGEPRPGAKRGELSEWLEEAEFKRRLGETLDFLRTQQRPDWETAVAEHQRFLDSLNLHGN